MVSEGGRAFFGEFEAGTILFARDLFAFAEAHGVLGREDGEDLSFWRDKSLEGYFHLFEAVKEGHAMALGAGEILRDFFGISHEFLGDHVGCSLALEQHLCVGDDGYVARREALGGLYDEGQPLRLGKADQGLRGCIQLNGGHEGEVIFPAEVGTFLLIEHGVGEFRAAA